MTDHRVTDLSYGHLGKASYDTDENKWNFSKDIGQKISIQQLLPLKECIPSSAQDAPEETEYPSIVIQRQLKYTLRVRPEIYPANSLIATLSKISSAEKYDLHNHTGALLAFGRAVDANRMAGSTRISSRRPRIFASPFGAAGHILQLALPRRETRAWGKRSGARLSVLDAFSLERVFWSSIGGPIYQITFSDDESGSGTWLAVRQAAVITLFRPIYGKLYNPPSASYLSEPFPPSLLNPNPVASLTPKTNDTRGYADVSFNPWFSRQFAVVDSSGRWEIYNLERIHDRDGLEKLVKNSEGEIYHDDANVEQSLKRPAAGHSDGWYRILWVCNLNTVILSSRRHLVLFDIRGTTTKVNNAEFLSSSSSDWILDIKLSSADKTHLFLLTTSRIYWVQVTPLGNNGKDDTIGIKVLLSYLHFRDPSDQTIKLTLREDDHFSTMITSLKSPLVNIYNFWTNTDGLGIPCGRQNSLAIHFDHSEGKSIQTICLTRSDLSLLALNSNSGPETRYAEQGVYFYQLWALHPDLSLSVTLCAVTLLGHGRAVGSLLHIKAPDTKVLKTSRHLERRVVAAPFIIPDGVGDEEPLVYNRSPVQPQDIRQSTHRDPLRQSLNWRGLFRIIWLTPRKNHASEYGNPPGISEILLHISEQLRRGIDEEFLTFRTLGEIHGSNEMKGDLDRASPVLQDFLGSLTRNQDANMSSTLILSDLTACPSLDIPLDEASRQPNLLKIYDQLVEQWLGTLPPEVSNRSRGSKFKVVRQIALDLCFNSIGLSLQKKVAASSLESASQQELTTAKGDTTTRESSPSIFSSQLAAIPGQEPEFRLPTPARTPSLYSQATSGSELREDPAITRLRQYTPSITAKAGFEKPAFLSHWPSLPGADPLLYSYESAQKSSANLESGDEGDERSRREQIRGRRRTEKFLRQERSRAVESASQAAAIPSGSQPGASRQLFSSQAIDDIPMTQPDRGVFGSRSVQGVKKPKKKRAAGFR